MGHFRGILMLRGERHQKRRSELFSVPTDVEPHPHGATRVDVSRCDIGPFVVGEVVSTGHDVDVREPLGATLLLPLRGRVSSVTEDGAEVSAEVGEALFFSPNRRRTRVENESGPDFLGVPMIVPGEELEQAAARLGISPKGMRGIDKFSICLARSNSSEISELMSLSMALYSEIARGSRRLVRKEAKLSWSRLLSEKLVEVLDAAELVTLPSAHDAGAANHHVRRATEYMRAHFGDVTLVSDVADACGISTRTLEAAFRSVLGISPQKFLTEIRLLEARRMLTGSGAGSVTDVAFACGFSHQGRFSAIYRRKYGERPSRTLGNS